MKKIFNLFIFLISFLALTTSVKAGSFGISANTTSLTVGNAVKVTVNISNLAGKFKIYSSDNSVLSGGVEDWFEGSTTVYFTAKKIGKATITVKAVDVADFDTGQAVTSSRSVTVNVIKKTSSSNNNNNSIDINKTYSKNNYLKSLSIEGYELSKAFDKETLEYTVELEPGEEKINVIATTEDKTASIKGAGEITVTEGNNIINIIVTAENGNERKYKIIANMEEKDPIEVKIKNKKYRVVKKRELINSKDGYKETTVKINDIEIPALLNEVTKVTLIGLKDEEGNITLFSYDTKSGKYEEYKEFSFDVMNLYIQEKKDSKYKKIKIKINGVDVVAYELEEIDDYYLLYATNTSTGYEGYYLYDSKENSVQRYDTTLLDKITSEKDKYLTMVIVLSCVCFLSMLFLLIEINKKNKNEV